MNIAVFIKRTTFHKGHGGLETQNKQLCEGLVEMGNSVTVFSPLWELDFEEEKRNGVTYSFVPCEYRTLFSAKKNNWYNKQVLFFQKYHNEKPFDLIISQSSAGLGVIEAKSELGIKAVSIAHGSIISELRTRYKNIDSLRSLIRLVPDTAFGLYVFFSRQRKFIFGSDKVIAVSKFVKSSLMEETYAPDEKFIVIHNGIDEKKFVDKFISGAEVIPDLEQNQKADLSESQSDEFRSIFVGRIEKEKGAHLLLKFFEDDRLLNLGLDIFGEGPLRKKLEKLVINKDLGNRIKIHGKVDYEEILNKYTSKETKLFLFPTNRYEGFPMVLVEAMMSGLPVIAFSMGGVSDAVIDSETGYLIPEGDVEAFKQAIIDLYNNDEIRKEMGINAYKKAIQEYTLNKMLNEYNKVFEEVLR